MIIYPIASQKNLYHKKSSIDAGSIISFKSALTDDYYRASRSGDIQKQIRALGNPQFDVSSIDVETGDNFLHSATKSGNRQVVNRAILLFAKKTNNNPDLANSILYQKNNDDKIPYDCTSNPEILQLLSRYYGQSVESPTVKTVPIETYQAYNEVKKPIELPSLDEIDEVSEEDLIESELQETESIAQLQKTKKLSSAEIDINDVPNLDDVAGLIKAKKILNNKIVKPLREGEKVSDNGFLLYGPSGSGKTFLLSSLAKTLNRQVITEQELEKLIENAIAKESDKSSDPSKENKSDDKKSDKKKTVSEIFDSSIIKVDDVLLLESVIDFAKENYKKTGKQAIIYIDEIKGILPEVSASNSNMITKAEQLIENSTSKGFVLIATTREKDAISPASIREGRFDNHIELKFPNLDERKEMFKKYMASYDEIPPADLKPILNKTSGFGYRNLRTIINQINEIDNPKSSDIEKIIKNYAKENDFGEIKEEGTTANYDTIFKREPVTMTFDDVIGMENVKNKFRKKLINNLKPEAMANLKRENLPPVQSGFLIYGPPGTGKTFIANAVAGESKLPMYKIDTSLIKDSLYGESEKKIRRLFKQLETKFEETGEYSILLIDEANSLLANRKKELSSSNLGSNDTSLVDLFLQYLNKAPERGIIPIAITNFKDEIDDAILDRLHTQINIPLPDEELRLSMVNGIFDKHKKYTKNLSAEDRKEITTRLSGFTSRNISAILYGILHENVVDNTPVTVDAVKKYISNFSVEHGLPEINDNNKTSGYDTKWKRESIKYPTSFDDVVGMDNVVKLFRETLIDRLKPEALNRFSKAGIKDPIQSNFLLYGPPGTGKTFVAEALAGELKVPLYKLTSADIRAGLYGESEKNIKSVFDQLENKFRETGEYSILFVDEANDLFGSAQNGGRSDTSLINLFLQRTNNSAQRGIITIAATNYKDQIEGAMLSRLGKHIYIALPDEKLIHSLVDTEFKKHEITSNISEKDINDLTARFKGFSTREITHRLRDTIRGHLTYSEEPLTIDDFKRGLSKPNVETDIYQTSDNSETIDNVVNDILFEVLNNAQIMEQFKQVGNLPGENAQSALKSAIKTSVLQSIHQLTDKNLKTLIDNFKIENSRIGDEQ